MITEQIKQQIIEAVKTHSTMRQAALSLDMPYRTFIYRAQKLGVYSPNQNQIGVAKGNANKSKIPLIEILEGNHPGYDVYQLRRRIVEEQILKYVCGICGLLPVWNGNALTLQLDHINGDRYDHRKDNLRFLCPNCHTQTETWGSRNKRTDVTDEEIIECYKKVGNIRGVMAELKTSNSSTSRYRIRDLIMGL